MNSVRDEGSSAEEEITAITGVEKLSLASSLDSLWLCLHGQHFTHFLVYFSNN